MGKLAGSLSGSILGGVASNRIYANTALLLASPPGFSGEFAYVNTPATLYVWNSIDNAWDNVASSPSGITGVVAFFMATNGQTIFNIGVPIQNVNLNEMEVVGMTMYYNVDFQVNPSNNTQIKYLNPSFPLNTGDIVRIKYFPI